MPGPQASGLEPRATEGHGRALHKAVTSSDWSFGKITPEVRHMWGGGRY